MVSIDKKDEIRKVIPEMPNGAVDIEAERDFKAANISRAKEALIAAFTSNPSLVSKAIADPSKPVEFVFNSVSLLTPDFARDLLGGVPAWNCKSGKDRTGMMDVECKFLATLVALGKEIPQPGAQLNPEQKLLYRNLLLQSGNHEMQKYNTGIAGYKLEGVGSITERIGDIASHKAFLGASKIVHS